MQIPMTYFRNYPQPYYPGWQSEPVPGWGVRPVMAGPARVGVGRLKFKASAVEESLRKECAHAYAASPERQAQLTEICAKIGAPIVLSEGGVEEDLAKPFPWLLVIASVGVVGGGVALAYNMGWLGRKKR